MVTHKEISAGFIAVAIGIVVVASAISLLLPSIISDRVDVMLGDGIFKTSIALNSVDRVNYMYKVNYLEKDDAVILAYPSISRWSVDFEHVNQSIDIVWLDKHKKVVEVLSNVNTSSLNNGRLTPDNSSKYVMILFSNRSVEKSISVGRYANIPINEIDIE